MHSFKSCLLVILLYLCSAALVNAQNCSVTITPPTQDPVCYGTQLTATATGTGTLRYQWQRNGVNIFGATQRNYPVDQSGSYTVVVSGASCGEPTTSAPVTVNVNNVEAKFNANKKERINPQSPAPLCGVPVKITLENESTGTGLRYIWEITDSQDQTPTSVSFIEGTNANSENPVLQFNEKGQYTVKLRVEFDGQCFDPANPEGPEDPIDPENPDADRDGRYEHEEQVIIVYPQVQPQGFQACENLTPGATVTIAGSQLAQFDYNLGQLRPGSLQWTVPAGVTVDDPTIESPQFTFPARGTYVLSVRFANECEFSDALPGSPVTEITVTFGPRPAKPVLPKSEDYICEGTPYQIEPSPGNPSRLYNFYLNTPTGGTPINGDTPQPFLSINPTGRTVYYIAEVINDCESLERAMFTIGLIQQELENTIGSDQTICADTEPTPLTGTEGMVGSIRPSGYLWESRSEDETEFAAAPTTKGRNDQQTYSPPALSTTTVFRRRVFFENCDETPLYSNEVTVQVLPVIDPATNVIEADKELVCEGTVPTLTGAPLGGGIEYVWQSSTTSATTGFINAVPADGTTNTDGLTFTPRFLTAPTWFRRMAKYAGTNCEAVPSNVILVNIDEIPAAPIVRAPEVEACEGKSAELAVEPVVADITYLWYTEQTGGEPIGSGSPWRTPALTANTTFYVEAVNQNECTSATRTAVRVSVVPISANAGRDTTIIEGQSMELKATGGTTYLWSPSTGLNNPNIANPVATPSRTTTYTVQVSNEAGCQATDEVTITVIPRVIVVNTFSPNQDGINETWTIENIENYPDATVEIFNRWGAKVFESRGYTTPWNGTHNGSFLPLATYYYIIRLNPNEKPITGSVTIIR